MIKRICTFYFTGTDTTKKVVEGLADEISKNLNVEDIFHYNFTKPEMRKSMPEFGEGDLVIAGVPTIAGRVPNLLLPYLKTINGNGALGVAIGMYGNRNVDDCLMELKELMKDGGINVIAGGAFIGEHSFSTVLAANRPDKKDMEKVIAFGKEISAKIKKEDFSEAEVCGEWPLRKYYTPRDRHGNGIDIRKVKPKTDPDKCVNCKECVAMCPLGSIDFDDVSKITGICMKCCACIKKCPQDAKYFDDEGYLYHMHELEDLYAGTRREPEYFL